jgi:hypothetical protein
MMHKFTTTNTNTYDDGIDNFLEVSKQCITCGGLWQGSKPFNETTPDDSLIPVYSIRGERPSSCEYLLGSDFHGYQGSYGGDLRKMLGIHCNCLLCES